MVCSGRAHADDAGFQQCRGHPVAEQRDLIGHRHVGGRRKIVGMDVDVPQSGKQVGALEVDRSSRFGVAGGRRPACGEDFLDAPVLDQNGGVGYRGGADAIDQRGIGQESAHAVRSVRAARNRPIVSLSGSACPGLVLKTLLLPRLGQSPCPKRLSRQIAASNAQTASDRQNSAPMTKTGSESSPAPMMFATTFSSMILAD